MKRIFFILIGLFSSFNSFSQVYQPIPTDSVYWLEKRVYQGGGCTYEFYDNIFPSGQVVIGSTTYTKLLCNENFISLIPSNWCAPTITYSNIIYGFYRNDSINKKVYWYDSVYTHQEILLYDFNLVQGDTVSPRPGSFSGDPNDTIIVSSIDSVDIGGVYRKSYALNSINGSNFTDTIIEGIGSQKSLFYHCYNINSCYSFSQSYSNLICYHYKNYEYTPLGENCFFGIGIDENDLSKNQFIQWIENNYYHITIIDNANIQVTCYDMLGKFIVERTFHESGYLDFSETPSGVYVMYIEYNGQAIKPYKFIISH